MFSKAHVSEGGEVAWRKEDNIDSTDYLWFVGYFGLQETS